MIERHFTGTVYILEQERVLLHFHHKLQKWLPFGGHVEEGETPDETAVREAKEECGLDVEIIVQENVWVEEIVAKSLPRPYLTLLENVPSYRNEPAHQHIDCIFLGRAVSGVLFSDPLIRWFTLNEIEALDTSTELFPETLHVLRHILDTKTLALAHAKSE